MKLLVLDVQGFKVENNRFTPKELAAYDGKKICHFLFKRPFNLNQLPPHLAKEANWLMQNHHYLPWYKGYTPIHKFSDIIKDITEEVDHVYVKGREKAEYIRKYSLKPVMELDENPTIQPGEPQCSHHSKSPSICALTNVYYLYNNFLMIE